MQISELAQRTSVSIHALRHYERLGLLRPQRRANGYRDYPESMQREVVFIAMSRQLGFGLPQIALRLAAYRNGTLRNADMVEALQERAAALEQQIAHLQAQRQQVLDHEAWLRLQQGPKGQKRPPSAAPLPPVRDGREVAAPWPSVRPVGDRPPTAAAPLSRKSS